MISAPVTWVNAASQGVTWKHRNSVGAEESGSSFNKGVWGQLFSCRASVLWWHRELRKSACQDLCEPFTHSLFRRVLQILIPGSILYQSLLFIPFLNSDPHSFLPQIGPWHPILVCVQLMFPLQVQRTVSKVAGLAHLSAFRSGLNNSHMPALYEHHSIHTSLLLSVICTLFFDLLVYLTNNYHFVLHFPVLIMFQINKHAALKCVFQNIAIRVASWNFTWNCWSR